MDERQKRKARNEALHRRVNDNLEQLNEAFSHFTNTFEIVCECDSLECTEQIVMSHAAYKELRLDPTRFAVVAGHEDPEVEDVVEPRSDYQIVQKKPGEPAAVAIRLDAAT